MIEAIRLIIPRLKRQLAHPLRLFHPLVLVHIHNPLVAPLPQFLHIPTLAIDAEVREGKRLRVNPVVRQDIRIGMAELVLHQHVHAVPEVDPPGLAVAVLERLVVAVILKGHLAQFVEAVRLMEAVKGGNIGIIAHVPVLVGEAGRGLGILTKGHDVGAADGEDAVRFVTLPQLVDFGAWLEAAPSRFLGRPKRAVQFDFVEFYVDVVE